MESNDHASIDSTHGSLADLQQSFNQQQAQISALKELVRQSEDDQGKNAASAQEKVRNIAQRLTHLKSKTRSRQSIDKSIDELREETSFNAGESSFRNDSFNRTAPQTPLSSGVSMPNVSRARSETPGSEKIQLLRQQMEQNRLKMAERETNKRGIEQLVTQLKAKFDSSQNSLDRAHLLGSSVGDLSSLSHSSQRYQSTGDLGGGAFNLDRERIKYLEKRIKHLENEVRQKDQQFLHKDPESEQSRIIQELNVRILDLEESLKEKDGLIQAKTKAANLITESMSMKDKDSVELLAETRQEMAKMQETFVATEGDYSKRIAALEKEIQAKDKKIANLEEANDVLETARFDLTLKNSELDSKTGNVDDYANKLNELNKINEMLQRRIECLENEKEEGGPSPDESEFIAKIQDLETTVSTLQDENDDLKKSLQSAMNTPTTDLDDQDIIRNLEATVAAQKEECVRLAETLQNVQDQLTEKTVEYNVLMANFNVLDEKLKSYGPKSLFSRSSDEEAQAEINKLAKQLDEANKTGIKTKLKLKQLQKQVDAFKKESDKNKELIKLMDDNQRLADKVKELETEILHLQSPQSALASAMDESDGDGNTSSTELQAKIKLLETTCQNQTSAIQLLEEQKLDMTSDLNTTRTELTSLKTQIKDHDKNELTTEIDSIVYEERIEQCQKQIEDLRCEIAKLNAEKADLRMKLDRFVVENMELLEKIDKLSKGSSVESIEILERLTQEERLEMDRFHRGVDADAHYHSHSGNEDGGSVSGADERKVSRSNSTNEGKKSDSDDAHASTKSDELIERIQTLQEENNELINSIEVLRAEKTQIHEKLDALEASNADALNRLEEKDGERLRLLENIAAINESNAKLESEIVALKKQGQQKSAESELHFIESDTYLAGMKSLTNELDNYRNAKDKNARLNVSKRLARESKNVAELMDSLLTSYNSCAEDFACYKAEIAGEKESRKKFEEEQIQQLASVHDNESELAELKEQLSQLDSGKSELIGKCSDLERTLDLKELELTELEKSSVSLEAENDRLNEAIKALEVELRENKECSAHEVQKQRKEFENLISINSSEMELLRELIEEQKQQLITAYTEHEEKLESVDGEIAEYNKQIARLTEELEQAQNAVTDNKQVDELAQQIQALESKLEENQKLAVEQSKELANKQSTIETLNQQIMDLYKSMETHAADIADKDDEIDHLQDTLDKNRAELKKLNQATLTGKHRVKELETEVQQKATEWANERTELENKIKEQHDKMKKFATNLKKRNAQCAELEEKCTSLERALEERPSERIVIQDVNAPIVETVAVQQTSNASMENESFESIKNLEASIKQMGADHQRETSALRAEIDVKINEVAKLKEQLQENTRRLDELLTESSQAQAEAQELRAQLSGLQAIKAELTATGEDLKAKNIKIEKCKAVIKEKNKEIKRLQEIEQAMKERSPEVSNSELKMDLDQLQTEKDKISLDYENYRTFIETKLQNNELVIESIEGDNKQLKERISRLEENIRKAEEHRSMLEHHSELLDTQLKEKQFQIESAEDEFSVKLQTLVLQDQLIEQKLKKLESERDHLLDTVKDQETQNDNLKMKNIAIERRLNEIESTRLAELEADNKEQSDRADKLQGELSRKQDELTQLAAAKNAELSDLENELSNHLKKIEFERRTIQEDLEKCREENAQLNEQIVQLQESQSNFERMRTDLEQEVSSVKLLNDNMTQDHLEAQDLRMQIVQNQTEVENLRSQNVELSSRYTHELNGLQLQLHEANELRLANEAQNQSAKDELIDENESLKAQICGDQAEIVNLRILNEQMSNDHEAEKSNLQAHRQQLENEIAILRQQINELNAHQMSVGQNVTQDQMEVHQLRLQFNHDQTEIESLRQQLQHLTASHEAESAALRQQIAELDSLRMQVGQNQTDDQVFIQNENERLQSVLAEKEIEIQNYQRQNLQLQMSAGMSSNDPFASISSGVIDNGADVSSLAAKVIELEGRLEAALYEAGQLQVQLADLQRLSVDKDVEIARLLDRTPNVAENLLSVSEPVITSHQSQALSLTPFDLHPTGAGDSNADQQIEDLQRNVSDLEKYVTDLEHKLKAATEEIAKNHAERMNLETNVASRVQQYEQQICQLQSDLESQRSELESLQTQQAQQEPVLEVVRSTASLFAEPFTPAANEFDNFGVAVQEDYSGQVPVVEEIIVPKKAYVCHPSSEATALSLGDDDAWGESAWSEANLEEQHQQKLLADRSSAMAQSTSSQHPEGKEMKQEREKNASDSSALQTRYKKLMKKLREYKEKIDELEAKVQQQPQQQPEAQPFECNDLDLAIQDELSNQIKVLEQRVKELKTELEKETQEKKRLLSRIDVLTSANDRMVEMKDRQDVEVEVCKAKIRELTGKLEKLNDWDDGDAKQDGSSDELAGKLAEAQNQNRLLEERINRMQASVQEGDDFEDEREQYLGQLRILSAEKVMFEENVHIKESEIVGLIEKLNALESQNNDYRATIEVLSVESTNIKTHLDQLKDEHTQKINENNDLSEKLRELMEKNVSLAKQMDEMRIFNLNSQDVEQRIQDLNACIQYKDSEIELLNDKIETDKRCFEEDFQQLKIDLVNNETIICELREEIKCLTVEREKIESSRSQAVASEHIADDLSAKVSELEKHVEQLQTEKVEMETELQVLNDQVLKNLEMEDRTKNIVLELDMKNIEITELKNTISQLSGNRANAAHADIAQWQQQVQQINDEHQAAIDSLNLQWQQVVDEKCTELADSWRQHLQGREDEFAAIEAELRAKLIQFEEEQSKSASPTSEIQQMSKSSELSSTDSQQQLSEQKFIDLDTDQSELMKTMQKALEGQEIEIVSLKEQLAIRSAEYARIAASVDPYGMKRTSITSNERAFEENLPKGNDLDLALYVLHQRDMRCEELTAEVIQLLEERDTLQLKLSNSIRQLEEFKRRCGFDGGPSEVTRTSPSKLNDSGGNDAAAADASGSDLPRSDNLNSKLSELHTVGHSRDKTLYEERDQRRRQMSFLQRDLSNMPPEAIAEARSQFDELFGSDFAHSSRNNQNPGSALLNWLFGSSSNNESDN